jgi:hypothetical protein
MDSMNINDKLLNIGTKQKPFKTTDALEQGAAQQQPSCDEQSWTHRADQSPMLHAGDTLGGLEAAAADISAWS